MGNAVIDDPVYVADFLRRWRGIERFAASITHVPIFAVPAGALPISPCDACPSAEYCTVPCPPRLAYWDASMQTLRQQAKEVGI